MDHFRAALEASKPDVPEGYALVPTEILDRFPELNPSNYDHDDACELNAWGVELVLAAATATPVQPACKRCNGEGGWERANSSTSYAWEECPDCEPVPPAAAVPVDGVLAYLDDLKDDAAAHIWPEDLERCRTSECVVEVTSVRMGSPEGRTVPLFSREQVADAIRAASSAGEQP